MITAYIKIFEKCSICGLICELWSPASTDPRHASHWHSVTCFLMLQLVWVAAMALKFWCLAYYHVWVEISTLCSPNVLIITSLGLGIVSNYYNYLELLIIQSEVSGDTRLPNTDILDRLDDSCPTNWGIIRVEGQHSWKASDHTKFILLAADFNLRLWVAVEVLWGAERWDITNAK